MDDNMANHNGHNKLGIACSENYTCTLAPARNIVGKRRS